MATDKDDDGHAVRDGRVARVRYGDEVATQQLWAHNPEWVRRPCRGNHCGVMPGELHSPHCPHEECPVCGTALVDCRRHEIAMDQGYGVLQWASEWVVDRAAA
jgi:hypothetical protein